MKHKRFVRQPFGSSDLDHLAMAIYREWHRGDDFGDADCEPWRLYRKESSDVVVQLFRRVAEAAIREHEKGYDTAIWEMEPDDYVLKEIATVNDSLTVAVESGVCRTCKWCDESEQRNGLCHAHPYRTKPDDYAISDGVNKDERVLCFPLVIPSMDWCDKWEWDGETRPESESLPAKHWICCDCGYVHGNKYGPNFRGSTWHMGNCDWCGEPASVTEARDFGL